MNKYLALLAASVVALTAAPAQAQGLPFCPVESGNCIQEIDLSHWSFMGLDPGTGATVVGSGTFTTTEFFQTADQITAATGYIYDAQVAPGVLFGITGVDTTYAGADGLLYNVIGDPSADFGGISFTTIVFRRLPRPVRTSLATPGLNSISAVAGSTLRNI
jgi:hypothetical protein